MAGKIDQRRRRRVRRHARVRKAVSGTPQRPRLAVHRSRRHIVAQVIDDTTGRTVSSASTLDADVRARLDGAAGGTVAAAAEVGRLVASRARAAGISQVVFDRGGYAYHGRVAALAAAARDEGLEL